MTAEDVLEMWDDIEGDIADPSSDERSDEELELDDRDEPFMDGSDDKFGDLWVVEESEEEVKIIIPATVRLALPRQKQIPPLSLLLAVSPTQWSPILRLTLLVLPHSLTLPRA